MKINFIARVFGVLRLKTHFLWFDYCAWFFNTIFEITIELNIPIFNMALVLTFAQFRRTFEAYESYERNMKTVPDDFNSVFEENIIEPTHGDRALIYF